MKSLCWQTRLTDSTNKLHALSFVSSIRLVFIDFWQERGIQWSHSLHYYYHYHHVSWPVTQEVVFICRSRSLTDFPSNYNSAQHVTVYIICKLFFLFHGFFLLISAFRDLSSSSKSVTWNVLPWKCTFHDLLSSFSHFSQFTKSFHWHFIIHWLLSKQFFLSYSQGPALYKSRHVLSLSLVQITALLSGVQVGEIQSMFQ